MDAIIGGYKVRMEETGLILKHPSGLSFDFLPNEVLGLWNFIDFYREQLSDTRAHFPTLSLLRRHSLQIASVQRFQFRRPLALSTLDECA
jgi:hypothetical protein